MPDPNTMKENTTPQQGSALPWSPGKIKAEIEKAGLSQRLIAKTHGLTPQAIGQAISGVSQGRLARRAIAESLGREVTEIWPGANLPLRERRLRTAS